MTKSSKEALTTFSSKGMLNRLLKYVPMLWLSIMTLACTNAVIGRRTVINHYRALQQALTTSRTTGNSPKTGVSANLENSFKKIAFRDLAVFGVFITFAFVEPMISNYQVIDKKITIPTIGYSFLCDKY